MLRIFCVACGVLAGVVVTGRAFSQAPPGIGDTPSSSEVALEIAEAVESPPVAPRQQAATYRYDPIADVSVTVASLAVAFGSTYVAHEVGGPTVRSVDDVFVIDRGIARRATVRIEARHASDVVLVSGVVLSGLGALFSQSRRGTDARGARVPMRRERFRRLGILIETLTTTVGVGSLVKLAARRPRPYTYAVGYDPEAGNLDDQASFFSGHTATVAAAGASLAYFAFAEHHERKAFAITTLTLGAATTGVVAMLRVRAGQHFPTDVITGAIVGASLGVLIPDVHLNTRARLSAVPVAGGGMLALSGVL